MRRNDRAQSQEFSLALIDRCTHGVLALHTGEDTPYCLPLSFVRIENRLYFHCAREGRKIDLLRRFPQVCVTFVGDDRPVFLPPEEKTLALQALCQKLTPEHMDGFQAALDSSLDITALWRIDMAEITGKAKLEH